MEITYDPLIVANYGLTVADVEDGIKSFIGKSDIVGDVMYRDEDGGAKPCHPLPEDLEVCPPDRRDAP